jgi:hypothetical protein
MAREVIEIQPDPGGDKADDPVGDHLVWDGHDGTFDD